MPLPGNLDFSSELGRGTQQFVMRSSAHLRLLVLSLSTEPGLLASELSLLASSAGPIGQRDSTESTEKRSHSRDKGRNNREVGHVASLYPTAHVWGTGKDVPITMPRDRIRVIAGETDRENKTPADLNLMTDLNCADQWECFIGPNGSGWRRVRNTEVQDQDADHCFTINGGCLASALDVNTLNASMNWSYPANVTWLKGFVTR